MPNNLSNTMFGSPGERGNEKRLQNLLIMCLICQKGEKEKNRKLKENDPLKIG